jgi:hypothetical protein
MRYRIKLIMEVICRLRGYTEVEGGEAEVLEGVINTLKLAMYGLVGVQLPKDNICVNVEGTLRFLDL